MAHGSEFSIVFSRAFAKVVVRVHGVLDADSAPELKDRLADLIDGQGNRQVIMDLRRVSDVDFAGVMVLFDAVMRMEEYGGELLLSGPTSGVAERLRAAGLGEVVLITPEWTHPAGGGVGANPRREHDNSR